MPYRISEKTIKVICPKCGAEIIVDKLCELEYHGWVDDKCPNCKEEKKDVRKDLQGQGNGSVS